MLRHGVLSTSLDPLSALLVVNGLGALGIGVLAGRLTTASNPAPWQAFVGLGLCGGVTTFSTHMVDIAVRLDEGEPLGALLSLGSVTAVALTAAFVGHRLAAGRSVAPA